MATPGHSAVELIELPPSLEHWQGTPNTWNLCVVLQGAGTWQYRRIIHPSRPGSVQIKEPGEPFSTPRIEQPLGFRMIRLPAELVVQHFSPLTKNLHLSLGHQPPPWLFRLICSAYERLGDPTTSHLAADSVVQLLMTEILATALEVPSILPASPAEDRVRWVRDYIEAHYDREISLGELAALAELHEVYVVRAFRKRYGIPPHAYQLRRRVLAARAHIKDGLPLVEASLAAGFCDQSHLTRHFKRLLGMTPGKYQQNWRTVQASPL